MIAQQRPCASREGGAPRPHGAIITGQGLHTGVSSAIRFVREPGPVRLRWINEGIEARIHGDALILDGSARATFLKTRDDRARVGTVEHLFAALGGLGIYEGVVVEIDGPEIPLADGGSRYFVDALLELAIPPSEATLIVAREGVIDVGESRYELSPSSSPRRRRRRIDVDVDFGDARLARRATWNGDVDDFRSRIAPARTFGFAHEVNDLLERGLANHVAPESVVVIAHDAILSAGAPFSADEPARHKLLDLIGDLYAHGGPPAGSIRATRPGHAATHEAIRRALAMGLLAATTR